MVGSLNPLDQKLFTVVGEVLHYIWDPIGVSGVPQARNEYDAYVGAVVALLHSGADIPEVSANLQRIADERMGLPDRKEQSDAAASVLTDWRDLLMGVGA